MDSYPPWAGAWRSLLAASKPFGGSRYLRRLSPPLLMARVIVLRTGLYVGLLFFIAAAIPDDGGVLAWILVLASTLWSAGAILFLRSRVPVALVRDRDPGDALAGLVSFLSGFAAIPGWVGFIGALFGGGAAPYVVGMLVSFGLLALSAPSPRLVANAQRAARAAGDDRDYHVAVVEGA